VIQLYAFPTPNGVKVSIALEELGLPYEAHKVTLADADVKSPEFLSLNPNNKIPAIIDPNGPGGAPIGLFESGRDPDLPGGKDRQASRVRPRPSGTRSSNG
jgi:GST-like protein